MFAPDEMRALKVLGPMYRDVIKKRSDEELKRFFEHAYIVWDDYSPPAKRNMDVDAEEQAWLINQREKVRTVSACSKWFISSFPYLCTSTFERHYDGLCGILRQIFLPEQKDLQRRHRSCTLFTIARSRPPKSHRYRFS